MSERDEDAGKKAEDLKDQVPAAGRAADEARDESADPAGEEGDDYREPGFDPDQRRFLWTITAVLVLAMFGSTGLNIAYQDRQRSRQLEANRATDEFRAADEAFAQARNTDLNVMARALAEHNETIYKKAMDHLMYTFQQRRKTMIDMRREQGLDETVAGPSEQDFAAAVEANVRRMVAEAPETRPATQAGTRPAMGPAGPAAPIGPAAPTGPAPQSP